MYSLEPQFTHLKLGIPTPDVGKKPDPFVTPSVMATGLPTPPFSPGLKAPWDDSVADQEVPNTGIPEAADNDSGFFSNLNPAQGTPNVVDGKDEASPGDMRPKERPKNTVATSETPSEPLQHFHCFSLLPAELRLKIWTLSFTPRTIELHSRRTHYADNEHNGGSPKWKSNSINPVALSVCIESRMAALEFYTVALPLDTPLSSSSRTHSSHCPEGGESNNRVLYLNLQHDTVALLGDLHFARLNKLLDWFREQERESPLSPQKGTSKRNKEGYIFGLRRLAMSTAPWAHHVGAATLRAFSRTVFRDLEEFVLFMYAEPVPPVEWRGRCELDEVSPGVDYYRRFVVGRGKQFVDPSSEEKKWMKVGRNEMRVAEIRFEDGW
ncbi:hypothetical protein QBC44DRAFT_336993 [Cladorrhinum sp. PSN332]|nr:hypothetical protein QBC44DRAFT_336993 [Cladorrhinum sp. PSN332]